MIEIKGLIETSFLDWDGKIVSTLYVPKCNFRCPFCHNYGLIFNPEQYETISFEKLESFLVEHKDFLDGICLTGGEPAIYKDLPDFLKKIKDLGLKCKLDTNGSFPEMLKFVIKKNLVDYIAMDVKAPLDKRYEKLAGTSVNLDKIKESIKIIMESGINYEFRTTVVPTLLDKNDIIDIAKAIKGCEKFALQQFQSKNTMSKELRKVKPYTVETLKDILKSLENYVKTVKIRGLKE